MSPYLTTVQCNAHSLKHVLKMHNEQMYIKKSNWENVLLGTLLVGQYSQSNSDMRMHAGIGKSDFM